MLQVKGTKANFCNLLKGQAIEYAITTWRKASKSKFQKAERVKSLSTPINEMETLTSLHSIKNRKGQKIVNQFTKFRHLKAHPMHGRVTE